MTHFDTIWTASVDLLLMFRGLCARNLRRMIIAVVDGIFNHLQDGRNAVVIDYSQILRN
jgi:hypothetical protein